MGPCIRLDGKIRGYLCVGNPTLSMTNYANQRVYFEMHSYCGPMRCRRDGNGSSADFPKWFWPLFERWRDNGQQVDQYKRCVLRRIGTFGEEVPDGK